MDNYKELFDMLNDKSAYEFFGDLDIQNMEDQTLIDKFLKADSAFWQLHDYLDRKARD